jgi:NAD+ synthase (glutamine-hydrolysing)
LGLGKNKQMQITLAQLNFHIGNFEGNLQKIEIAIQKAMTQNAELIVFPELAVCGYPPRDFLEFNDFIQQSKDTVDAIAAVTAKSEIGVIIGGPRVNPVIEGKDLFNSAFLIYRGKMQQTADKTLLPTYDIFDEYRYFEPGSTFQTFNFKGIKIALTICEDLWNIGNENPLYTICPMDELKKQNPDLMINIAASPFDYTHAKSRLEVLKTNCLKYELPLMYVNHTGAQTEILFDGGSLLLNEKGQVIHEFPYFEEAVQTFDLELLNSEKNTVKKEEQRSKDKYPLIYKGLVEGIRNYFQKLGFQDAILGLSGGIDSALVLVLAAEALGKSHVTAYLMPSQYSSEGSVSDSKTLCKNLGVKFEIIPIEHAFKTMLRELKPLFRNMPHNIAEENIQARIRSVYLMAISNKFGPILLNTSNKSEGAVGYTTLYGDMSGGLSVIGDVYKTGVYGLCRLINREREIIPQNILDKPPSAELRPRQKDSDSLPDYEILDKILVEYIENRKGPDEIKAMGFDAGLVDLILKMVNTNEYKRFQTPPILRVSPKAFGMGRRLPIVAKYLS